MEMLDIVLCLIAIGIVITIGLFVFELASEEETINIRIDEVRKEPVMKYHVTMVDFYDLDENIYYSWEFNENDYEELKEIEGKEVKLFYKDMFGQKHFEKAEER